MISKTVWIRCITERDMCFSLKRRESMIIVDPFVICRRGGGCIWIRSKLSECDMCSMRQGHRATGQTSSFHTHFCYIFWKLDFIVRKKMTKLGMEFRYKVTQSNNFLGESNDVFLILLHHSRENSYRVSTPLRQGLIKGHYRYAYSPTILYQKL